MTLQSGWDKTGTANVVTIIFGGSENSDGQPKNSAIPGELDAWFHGDDRTSRPEQLEGASGALGTKTLDEYSQSFPNYRIRTGVEIGLDTPDGRTIPTSGYEVQMDEPDPSTASDITLESDAEAIHNPFRNELDHYDGTNDHIEANTNGPHMTHQRESVPDGNGGSVEGIRASVIYGGNDRYLVMAKDDGLSLFGDLTSGFISEAIKRYYREVATFYVFSEFVLMADGTKLVRVWDASVYSAHALYVGVGSSSGRRRFGRGSSGRGMGR